MVPGPASSKYKEHIHFSPGQRQALIRPEYDDPLGAIIVDIKKV